MAFLLDQIGSGVAGLSPSRHPDRPGDQSGQHRTAHPRAPVAHPLRGPEGAGARRAPAAGQHQRHRPVAGHALRDRAPPRPRARRARCGGQGRRGADRPRGVPRLAGLHGDLGAGHWRLLAFFQEVRLAGWDEELPRSAYPPEETRCRSAPPHACSPTMCCARPPASPPWRRGSTPTLVLMGILVAGEDPVSASELARRLGLPTETVRRHAPASSPRTGSAAPSPRALSSTTPTCRMTSGPTSSAATRSTSTPVRRSLRTRDRRGLGPPRAGGGRRRPSGARG